MLLRTASGRKRHELASKMDERAGLKRMASFFRYERATADSRGDFIHEKVGGMHHQGLTIRHAGSTFTEMQKW